MLSSLWCTPTINSGCHVAQMVELFGSVRDAWIQEDLDGWLAPNRIYEGVADPVRQAMQQHEVYIVTTKQVGDGGCRYRDTR